MTDASSIVQQNEERADTLREQWGDYDPILGIGSPIPRVPLRWRTGKGVIHIPATMLDDELAGEMLTRCHASSMSVEDYCQGSIPPNLWDLFISRRVRHDYEYWCATCVTIENKTGDHVPLILNPPQRHSLRERERQRVAGLPIRDIECKHRQYGSTTDKGLYAGLWLPVVVYGKGNAYAISLESGGAAKIRRRIEMASKEHPPLLAQAGEKPVGPITFSAVPQAPNSREYDQTGGMLSIASANNPQGPSGDTVRYVVISEAGKMVSGEGVNTADRLITNIMSTVPMESGSCVLVESTAEAVGRWYKAEWDRATSGDSAFSATFVSWRLDSQCWRELATAPLVMEAGSVEDWIRSWFGRDEYLTELWDTHGCSLEQVAWYQQKRREYPELWMMQQENPTTAAEAFQFGERRRFLVPHVQTARRSCTEPVRGQLVGDATTGREALNNLRFEPEAQGELSIWHPPDDEYGGLIQPGRYIHSHIAAMDIGGVWEGADYTVVTVLDRRPLVHGLPPVVAAEWHGHLDQDLAAWVAAQIAAYYNNALLAVEVNSLREDMGDPDEGLEADHGMTVLDQIALAYPNLYRRTIYDKRTKEPVSKLGFHTNRATKPLVIDTLHRFLRETHEDEGGYVERSVDACSELDTYLRLDSGAMAAAPGCKDDRVMSRAIGLQVHEEAAPCRHLAPDAGRKRNTAARRAAIAAASV